MTDEQVSNRYQMSINGTDLEKIKELYLGDTPNTCSDIQTLHDYIRYLLNRIEELEEEIRNHNADFVKESALHNEENAELKKKVKELEELDKTAKEHYLRNIASDYKDEYLYHLKDVEKENTELKNQLEQEKAFESAWMKESANYKALELENEELKKKVEELKEFNFQAAKEWMNLKNETQ